MADHIYEVIPSPQGWMIKMSDQIVASQVGSVDVAMKRIHDWEWGSGKLTKIQIYDANGLVQSELYSFSPRPAEEARSLISR